MLHGNVNSSRWNRLIAKLVNLTKVLLCKSFITKLANLTKVLCWTKSDSIQSLLSPKSNIWDYKLIESPSLEILSIQAGCLLHWASDRFYPNVSHQLFCVKTENLPGLCLNMSCYLKTCMAEHLIAFIWICRRLFCVKTWMTLYHSRLRNTLITKKHDFQNFTSYERHEIYCKSLRGNTDPFDQTMGPK